MKLEADVKTGPNWHWEATPESLGAKPSASFYESWCGLTMWGSLVLKALSHNVESEPNILRSLLPGKPGRRF